jgi:hypothetical protein
MCRREVWVGVIENENVKEDTIELKKHSTFYLISCGPDWNIRPLLGFLNII